MGMSLVDWEIEATVFIIGDKCFLQFLSLVSSVVFIGAFKFNNAAKP